MPWDVESRSQRWKRLHPQPAADHSTKAYRRRRMEDPRLALAQRLRSSQRWQDFRAWWLRRNPLCASCAKRKKTVGATQLDHVKALRRFSLEAMEEACFDEGNVQSLCSTCHAKKSAREQADDRKQAPNQGSEAVAEKPIPVPHEVPQPEPGALKVRLEVLGSTLDGVLQTLRLEPGDLLTLAVEERLSASTLSHLRACMQELAPAGVKVAILEQGLRLVRVRPPSEDQAPPV